MKKPLPSFAANFTNTKFVRISILLILAAMLYSEMTFAGVTPSKKIKNDHSPKVKHRTNRAALAPPLTAPVISYTTTAQVYKTGVPLTPLPCKNTGGTVPDGLYGTVNTLAGTGNYGSVNGPALSATFSDPVSMATDNAGNIYVVDELGENIRKIDASGNVTTLAGSGSIGSANGVGIAASFYQPGGIATDTAGNIYVGDTNNNLIRKITPGGTVTTLAGTGAFGINNGAAATATFSEPTGIVVDASGNIYIADTGNQVIRKITSAGVVSTFAGGATVFNQILGLGIDKSGNIYAADAGANKIMKITPAGVVTTLAGSGTAGAANGTGAAATFNFPAGVTADGSGNVYVADAANNLVRKITPGGLVTTIAGGQYAGNQNGVGSGANFNYPYDVVLDNSNNLYVCDGSGQLIRKIFLYGYAVTPALPGEIVLDPQGSIRGTPSIASANTLYTISASNVYGSGSTTVHISATSSQPKITYSAPPVYKVGTAITALPPANTGGAIPNVAYGQVSAFAGSTQGKTNGTGASASFYSPNGMAYDNAGNLYVADGGNNLVRKITAAGVVTTFAGNGTVGSKDSTAANASFNAPFGIAIDTANNVYVSEPKNSDIRKITQAGIVTTYVTGLGSPEQIAFDADQNIYTVDYSTSVLTKISPAGVKTILSKLDNYNFLGLAITPGGIIYVSNNQGDIFEINQQGALLNFLTNPTAGDGDGPTTVATFNYPGLLVADALGNIYVADSKNNKIRKLSPSGYISTVAGDGMATTVNGIGAGASFNYPLGMAIDPSGNVVVSSTGDNTIRKVAVTGYTVSPALPAGLILNAATGVISGTPTIASKVATYTIIGSNSGGVDTALVSITVNGGPVISYESPQNFRVSKSIGSLAPANIGGAIAAAVYGTVSTLAGSGTAGATNGTGVAASFSSPAGTVEDAIGNIYVADQANNLIRKITPGGVTTTFAGSGTTGSANGTGTAASFNHPAGLGIDKSGNICVADAANNLIRKITPAGVVSTFAGSGVAGATNGTGTAATFNAPLGIAVDASNNLYVADAANNRIRKITSAGVVTTLAGSGVAGETNGTGTAATFNDPSGVTVDASGNVYVADQNSNLIRKITSAGVVTTFAGSGAAGAVNGTGTAASFSHPAALTFDVEGDLYVADKSNNLIRKITPAGVVTTFAGSTTAGNTNGILTAASFKLPFGLSVDPASGNLYIADQGNQLIRKIILTGYTINAALPTGLSFSGSTGAIAGTPTVVTTATTYTVNAYNAYGTSQATISIAVIAAPAPFTISYSTPHTYIQQSAITPLVPTNNGGVFSSGGYLMPSTFVGPSSGLNIPEGIATDAAGNLYIGDTGSHLILKVTPAGVVTTFAGSGQNSVADGTGTAASFNAPGFLTVDNSGNVYVSEYFFNVIRKITPTGVVTTLAGSGDGASIDGLGKSASFYIPAGLAVDASGNVYVVDEVSSLIRKITPGGLVTTFAGGATGKAVNGTGAAASFYLPEGIAADAQGNLYVADAGNSLIRKITPAGVVTTFAGSGTAGSADGLTTTASFNFPSDLKFDTLGNLYVSDNSNNSIRKITPAGLVSTILTTTVPGQYYGVANLALDGSGNLYAVDETNHLIDKIPLSGFRISPALPLEMAFNAATGVISGTPTFTSAATNYKVTAYSLSGDSASATINIGVKADPAPNFSYDGPQNYTIGKAIIPLAPNNAGSKIPSLTYQQVSTLAGSTTAGSTNGTGTAASFSSPFGAAADAAGNIYIGDEANNLIRKITAAGVVTTLAGSGTAGRANGTGTAATFNKPAGLAVDASGNVYVADQGNNLIRKITSAGVVTTLAGSGTAGSANGTGAAATFNSPTGVTVDASGNVYVADKLNNIIRKITSAGVVTTFAGSGTAGAVNAVGAAASFSSPTGLTIDAAGNVFVADEGNNMVRKITSAGVVTTLAGTGAAGAANGAAAAATFHSPYAVAVDGQDNVFVADYNNNEIREINKSAVVSTLAGSTTAGAVNAVGTSASFKTPAGLALDASSHLYISDLGNNQIRTLDVGGYTINTALPVGLAFNGATGTITGTPTVLTAATIYTITAYTSGGYATATLSITVSNPATLPVISYGGAQTYYAGSAIAPLSPTNTGGAVPANHYQLVSTLAGSSSNYGSANGTGAAASFEYPWGIITDKAGNIYVADGSSNSIRKITPAGVVTTFAGSGRPGAADGTGTAASFNNPNNMGIDAADNIYVAEFGNNLIRKITPNAVVTTIAGSGKAGFTNGAGPAASFNKPTAVTVDGSGNLYVADAGNNAIRKITPSGVVTTFAGNATAGFVNGTGIAASFNYPSGVATDAAGNVYVADESNHSIRKITTAGVVTTFAGSGIAGDVNGSGTKASFYYPTGVAVDAGGNVFVADFSNNEIRKITPAGGVTTIAGNGAAGALNGTGAAATFNGPANVAVDGLGNLYVVDDYNYLIRKIGISGYVISPALPAGLSFNGTTGAITGTPTAAAAAATHTITAYNQYGFGTTTLSITVSSVNPELKTLTISSGTLTPVFAPSTTSYTASVANTVSSITLTPTTADASATVKVNGKAVASGSPSGAVALSVGANTITTVVTAKDGATTNTYTLTVTRAASGANIPDEALSVSAPSETPALQNDGIVVHAGISPNGDGINDFLQIDSISLYPENKLSIMNRNGQLVYEAKGYDNITKTFDGHSNKTGAMQLPGTYFYSLDYKVRGEIRHKTGFIVLKY